MSHLLSSAIKLRKQPIDDLEFYAQAARIRSEIQAAMDQPARHLGIRRIQDIFRNNKHRAAYSEEQALEIMAEGRGEHFEPRIFDCFVELLPEMRRIGEEFKDWEDRGAMSSHHLQDGGMERAK